MTRTSRVAGHEAHAHLLVGIARDPSERIAGVPCPTLTRVSLPIVHLRSKLQGLRRRPSAAHYLHEESGTAVLSGHGRARGRARVPSGRLSIRDRLRAPCPSDRAGNGPDRSGVGHEKPVRTLQKIDRQGHTESIEVASGRRRVSTLTRHVTRSRKPLGGVARCGPRLL